MMRTKLKSCPTGAWFAVPLPDGHGWVKGLAARTTPHGCILGYFFGPKSDSLPVIESCSELSAKDSMFQAIFGDPGLLIGEWPILGQQPGFRREDWPVPGFVHRDVISGEPRLRHYDDETLEMASENAIPESEANRYSDDGVYGYVALQIRLSREFAGLSAD